jgi:SAM-dependent methyltransferase
LDLDSLRERRSEVERWLDSAGLASSLSASRYLLHKKVALALEKNVHGRVLEAGAGGSPFSAILRDLSEELVTLDIEDRYGDIDLVADIHEMTEVESDSFDVVVCTQVLEHLKDPQRALQEIRRVLHDDGVAIVSAPHLSMIHEAPNDYFRFTPFGLKELCLQADLQPLSLEATGGLIAFLLHPISLAWMVLLGRFRALRRLAWAVNQVLFVKLGSVLDTVFGAASLFPVDHVVVARPSSKDEGH